jgi:hypothetical protein
MVNSEHFTQYGIFQTLKEIYKHLTPTLCTLLLFINYCSNMFWPQILAIF